MGLDGHMRPGAVDRLRFTLQRYDAESQWWGRANSDADGSPVVRDCERHSEALEELAHAFAEDVRTLVVEVFGEARHLSIVPADEKAQAYRGLVRGLLGQPAEPLGGPIPGVNGDLPEHSDGP